MKAVWIHPFNGIAGDMTLGALIAAGADVDVLRSQLETLGVDGWTLHAEPISRNGIGAINVTVETNEGHSHRTAAHIIALVEEAALPQRVTERAIAVFTALAEAEGRVHQVDPAKVHFHEVGGIDAIIDVVGSCLALEALDIEYVAVAPVAVGHGLARSAHGIISNPAPATTHLLEGVPVKGLDVRLELTTPTGAALVRALADSFGPMPEMTITSAGFGAGDTELDEHPNLLHVIIGELSAVPITTTDQLVVLEANVDDLSGEYLAHAVTKLLSSGALDAWVTPVEMKHGRPAVTISALTEPAAVQSIGEVLLAESGSLGYRSRGVERSALDRRFESVELEGHAISLKITNNTAKAEFGDVARVSDELGRPARIVAAQAEQLWRDASENREVSGH